MPIAEEFEQVTTNLRIRAVPDYAFKKGSTNIDFPQIA